MAPESAPESHQLISGPLQPPQGSILGTEDKGEMLTTSGSSNHP